MGLSFKPNRSIYLALLSGLCWFAQGVGQANFGNETNFPSFLDQFPHLNSNAPGISAGTKSHRSLIVGTVTAVYELGLAGGGLSTYFIGDRLGRKRTALVAAVVVIIGSVIEASSYSVAQLIVGRIVAGLGIGAFTATVPAWVTESVAPRLRGALVMVGGGFAITGVASMSWVGLGMYLHQRHNSFGWRFPLALQGIVAVLVIIGTLTQYESPRSLVRMNRRDDAFKVMQKLRGDEDPHVIEEEFTEIIQAYENEINAKDKSPWLFNRHKQFRRTMTAIILSGLCQMSGINLITFYGSIIFEDDIGLSATKSKISLAGLQTFQALCAFSAAWFVTRFGRRNLLLGGSATMCICFCCCAGLASSKSDGANDAILAFDAIQLAAYPIGLLINPFLIGSEISGLLSRSAVMACVSFANWLMNFVIALVTPIGFDRIHYKYYTIYIATNAALFIFSFLFVPETKGLTLEEIDQAYVNSRTPFDIVRTAKAIRQAGHVPPEVPTFDPSKDDEKGEVQYVEDVEKEPQTPRSSLYEVNGA